MKSESILLDAFATDLCPDVVEWRPNKNVLLCGTYEVLDNQETLKAYDIKRCGNITLMNIVNDKLNVLQSIETNAIFDIKWNYNKNDEFASVDAKGNLCIYECEDDQFKQMSEMKVFDEHLAIHIDWNRRDSNEVIVTGSNGSITVCDISNKSLKHCWRAHDFECWNAIYDIWDDNTIYSGGDDSTLLKWDLRDTSKPSLRNKRHDAGVCAISCNPNVEHQILTGSYDDHLRIFDCRFLSKHAIMEINLNGGVWKLKWHPEISNILAVPCMYGGLKIVEIGNASINVINTLREEGPLSYGVDWSNENESNYLAGCFFYEKRIHLHNVMIKS